MVTGAGSFINRRPTARGPLGHVPLEMQRVRILVQHSLYAYFDSKINHYLPLKLYNTTRIYLDMSI